MFRDDRTQRWYFLPRKASFTRFEAVEDQFKGSNLLLIASADFSIIEIKTIGPLEREYGFTSLKKIPGSKELFMALKVKEVTIEDEMCEKVQQLNVSGSSASSQVMHITKASSAITHSKLCIFDLNGNMYLGQLGLDPGFVHVSDQKFEGLEFL